MRLINRKPGPALSLALALLPFVAVLLVYAIASDQRLSVNPQDRLLPSPATILQTAGQLFTEPDRRSGRILLWDDTAASLFRLLSGVGIAGALALLFGILIGMLPYLRSLLSGFVAALSMVPPLAILPILFLLFGLGEVSKIVLIVIGTAPVMVRDMTNRVMEIPREQIIKAQTLGASSLVIALRVVLPQILPRLISNLRLSLGAAWLFLIAAEAVASEVGLGYRIFLVRRFLAMDVILTYVLWITALAFVLDWALRTLSRRAFRWAEVAL
jgi:NitT/TauT family transport system permease protein